MAIPHPSSLIPPGASRREDSRLVSGQGRYTSDWNLPDQLHAAFLRADRAHAEITRLDAARALAHPGVKAVLTGADVTAAGSSRCPTSLPIPARAAADEKPHHPVLALERVRYVGEPVAMIVADTAAAAEDARELIDVEYRDLPATASFDAAVAPGAPQLHADCRQPRVRVRVGRRAGGRGRVRARKARQQAHHGQPAPLRQRHGAARLPGGVRRSRRLLHDLRAVQGVGGMVGQISAVSGVDKSKIVMATQDVGGSFGVRGPAYHEYFAAMLAARKLGRPVKWVGSRSEVFVSDFHGRAISLTGELASMPTAGSSPYASMTVATWAPMARRSAPSSPREHHHHDGGVYRVPALYARTRLAYTNTVPISPTAAQDAPTSLMPSSGWWTTRPTSTATTRSSCGARTLFRATPCRTRRRTPGPTIPGFRGGDGRRHEARRLGRLPAAPRGGRAGAQAARDRHATYLEAGGGGAAPKTRSPSSSTPTAP